VGFLREFPNQASENKEIVR